MSDTPPTSASNGQQDRIQGSAATAVWLVLDNNGATVAVLEDDAEFAAKVAEVNRGWGWTVRRTVVRRNREGER